MDFIREGDVFEKLGIGVPTPKTFCKYPMESISKKCESETVALNIMVILSRTGNKFRLLEWKEYKKERLKDRNFSEFEKVFFDFVVTYCTSLESAISFSPRWAELVKS